MQLAAKLDNVASEGTQHNEAILTKLQLELDRQQGLVSAETASRESDLQTLAEQMQAGDNAIQAAVERRFNTTEKELSQNAESLAVQQISLAELEERFMVALKEQDTAHEQQLAILQADLDQTKKELAAVQTKHLLVESRIGLSDTQ